MCRARLGHFKRARAAANETATRDATVLTMLALLPGGKLSG